MRVTDLIQENTAHQRKQSVITFLESYGFHSVTVEVSLPGIYYAANVTAVRGVVKTRWQATGPDEVSLFDWLMMQIEDTLVEMGLIQP